jgi:hypothetical protein
MTPKQQMILTILIFALSPAIFGVLGEAIGANRVGDALSGISAVLIPIGIVWAVFRYRAQLSLMQQQQQQQQQPQPLQPPVSQQPSLPPQSYQPPVASVPPPTNPLATPHRGSVTEDETQKLPGQKQ